MGLVMSSALVACGGGGSGGGDTPTLSVNADLTTLTLSAGTLDQIFDSAQLNYTATVSFLTASTQVTATVSDAGATLTINGVAVASGVLSNAIALVEGGNPITIVVTAAAGNTRTYIINVTRESATAVDLSAITLSAGSLDQIFDSALLNYTETVSFLTASIQVAATVFDTGATLTVNGTPAASGVLSDAIALAEGSNPIAVVVTTAAGDTQTYTVNITRESVAVFAQQAYIKASNTNQDDVFGASVALSGDTLAVGTGFEDSAATGIGGNQLDNSATESGAVYVFTRTAGVWSQQAYIKASNTNQDDLFGNAVALSGDTLVVGAASEDSAATGVNGSQLDNSVPSSGAVYVFKRNATTWTQQAYIKASNTNQGDQFGVSVAIAGDTLAVGASGERSGATGVNGDQLSNGVSGAGAVYVFTRSGTIWTQQAYVKASNTQLEDFFGASVALSGDTLAVGATFEDSVATGINGNQSDNSVASAGAVYVFTRSGTTWSQQAYVKASNTNLADGFGASVTLSGDTLAIGAQFEDSVATGVNGDQLDNTALSSGAVYVFTRNGTVWTQQAYIKASNTDQSDEFGKTVALSGDLLAVGASFEDSLGTGINGNELDNTITESGAVYVFTRSGNTWSQQSYVKASNTDQGDGFADSLALSGGTLVVGASSEDSMETGINGIQSDDSVISSGAIYVFE